MGKRRKFSGDVKATVATESGMAMLQWDCSRVFAPELTVSFQKPFKKQFCATTLWSFFPKEVKKQ